MKVCIIGNYHHKNEYSLRRSIEILNWTLTSFRDAQVIFSADQYIDTENYRDKVFIFGPHFSVFPDTISRSIKDTGKCVYIQPSTSVYTLWKDEFQFNNIPVVVYAFGVNVDMFCPVEPINTVRNKVFVYFKRRKQSELKVILNFLKTRNITPVILEYGKYKETEYKQLLNESAFGIWLGTHESQGFALQEALSMNVPLLVWNVTRLSQEEGCDSQYLSIQTRFSTVPYWNECCGELFYEEDELVSVYNKFIQNIHQYTPREYIVNNLSINVRTHALEKMIHDIIYQT